MLLTPPWLFRRKQLPICTSFYRLFFFTFLHPSLLLFLSSLISLRLFPSPKKSFSFGKRRGSFFTRRSTISTSLSGCFWIAAFEIHTNKQGIGVNSVASLPLGLKSISDLTHFSRLSSLLPKSRSANFVDITLAIDGALGHEQRLAKASSLAMLGPVWALLLNLYRAIAAG